jgi:hypothetical protein
VVFFHFMLTSIDILDGPFEFDDSYSLVVVRHAGCVALGRKTRGYGTGRLVLPGGKNRYYIGGDGIGIVPEDIEASREVKEELGVNTNANQVGVLHITDEYDIRKIAIFEAHCADPALQVSDELTELAWRSDDSLSYNEMPSDYALWLPHIVAGYAITAFLESSEGVVVDGTIIRQQLNPLGRAEQIAI